MWGSSRPPSLFISGCCLLMWMASRIFRGKYSVSRSIMRVESQSMWSGIELVFRQSGRTVSRRDQLLELIAELNFLNWIDCMFYLGPFSIKGVQYTQCDMIPNTWTKAHTWKSYDCYWARDSALAPLESETTAIEEKNRMNLNQYKGIKYEC